MTMEPPGSGEQSGASMPTPTPMASTPPGEQQPSGSQPIVVQTQREGLGRVFGRTLIQSIVWCTALATALLFVTVVGLFVMIAGIAAVTGGGGDTSETEYTFVYGDENSSRKLLAIPVSGVIYGDPGEGGGGLFGSSGATYGYEVKQQIIDAIDDDQFDGVILIMDTPGGTIYGSQAINEGVQEFKAKSSKPIVAWVSSMSASGGMLGMSHATRILADHGTLIGSIGVRLGPFEYYDKVTAVDGPFFSGGVTTQNGITYSEITAGRGKDEGSPYRPLTDEERANFQRGVDNSYGEFVQTVSTGRKIPPATITDKIGALIYDEITAKQLNLIDGIANREDAFRQTAELAKLRPNNFQVVREKQPGGGLLGLFGMNKQAPPAATYGATGPSYANCIARRSPMAYYGSLAALCGR